MFALVWKGKEEFEKNQKQLLEKGNIIRHNKTQLEQQQVCVLLFNKSKGIIKLCKPGKKSY